MDPAPKLWTLEDWDRMIDSGLLGEDDPVLLLEGEIYQMCAQNSPHATAVGLVQDVLGARLPPRTFLRVQLPLYLGTASDPEPDLAVVRGTRRDFAGEHPRGAVLVVEVADSSLAFDCGRKAQVYARYGIPEYWVVDVQGRCVHRFTGPHEVGYSQKEVLTVEDRLAWNRASISVAELLPY